MLQAIWRDNAQAAAGGDAAELGGDGRCQIVLCWCWNNLLVLLCWWWWVVVVMRVALTVHCPRTMM